MVSFFIFISTIALVPHYVILFALIVLVYKNYKSILYNKFTLKPNLNLIIISLIVLISIINKLLNPIQLNGIMSVFPYTILMFTSYIIAKYISKKDIKILVIFIAFEVVVGMLEYILKVNSVFYWEDFFTKYNNDNLMYFSKVFGLSVNSSVLAVKITIAILLIEYYKLFEKKYRYIIRIILFIGLYITFQRTSIIVVLLFYFMQIFKLIINEINPINFTMSINKFITRSILAFVVILLFVLIIVNKQKILNQFSKGKGKIELSGREEIWPKYISFIKNNILFGNYSNKYYVRYRGNDEGAHAHNSFLEVFSTHGIFIFILYLLIIIININRNNYLFIGSLVVLSLFQYALFWGISLVDIVLYIFAINIPKYNIN